MVHDELMYRNTKVFFRFLPIFDAAWNSIKILEDRRSLYVRTKEVPIATENSIPSFWKFDTDGIFYNNAQHEVFGAIMEGNVLESIFEGCNGIVLCYGQTYSGKTVTASGLNNNFEDRGIIPRTIEELFKIREREMHKAKISISIKYVETNRNYIRNLLDDFEELYDINSIDGLQALPIKEFCKAMQLIFNAEIKKTFRYRDTYLSNMANSVLTFIVSCKSFATSYTTIGKLHIVDLCGADTEGNLACLHKNGLEVGVGNLAKTQLEQFLIILNNNNSINTIVKHRLSILIYYLRDALNNQSIFRFIGHIRASNQDSRVGISLLRFGQLVKGLIPQKLQSNILKDQETEMKMLKDELCMLKREKDLNSMLNNEDLLANLSQDRYEFIQKLAHDYLHDKSSEIVILNTADAMLAMKVFKNIYNKIEFERQALFELTRQQEETQTESKRRDGSISSKVSKKNSKYSNNSMVSLNKGKKSTSKKTIKSSKESKKDFASLAEYPESIQRSRHSSKLIRRRSSKKRSCDSSLGFKSETSVNANGSSKLPETVPSHTEAWEIFIANSEFKYAEMKEELDVIEQNMVDVYNIYCIEVENLKDANQLVNTRQEELTKANLLKDLEQTVEPDGSIIPTELELKCLENMKLAGNRLIAQKEMVLKIQAELKLVMDCKSKIKGDIEKKYEEFCKFNYKISVPNLHAESILNSHMTNSKSCEISMVNSEAQDQAAQEEEVDLNPAIIMYNEFRKCMRREYLKRLRNMKKNKKWIKYCKLLV